MDDGRHSATATGGRVKMTRCVEGHCWYKGNSKSYRLCEICIPKAARKRTVSHFRKTRDDRTGLGPEGLQMLIITHPHLQQALDRRRLPCLTFADYDVAPHGFHDFYDAVQMFCSNNTLGLGIGNVDRNYPLFAIPALKLMD